MEPVNCTAEVLPDRVEGWAPTQAQTGNVAAAAAAAGVSADKVIGQLLERSQHRKKLTVVTNDRAVASIFEAKGRPQFNPLIVHVADLAAAEVIAEFTPLARELAPAKKNAVVTSESRISAATSIAAEPEKRARKASSRVRG